MKWNINITYVLCMFLYIGLEIYNVCAVQIDCTIPRGAWFRRSMYRQRSGSTKNYPAGSRVSHGTEIVAICRKDVYGDLITGWTVTQCIDGNWTPGLPSCIVRKRCRAPPGIKYAKPSDTVTPQKTFPHGTVLTYTCDVGKMATGNGTTVCNNGRWTATGFKCEGTTTTTRADELCSRLPINNGQTFVKDASIGTYDVKCDKGYKLAVDKVYKCRDGKWIGKEPECRKVQIDCTIPRGAWFRRSMYRQRSGSTKNYPAGSKVSHGTEIVAICRKDVYGDLITGWTVTQCIDGNWTPGLPSCKVKRRCRAPPKIKHAKPSDTVTPNKTFPHGSVLTYKCDVGRMATGNGTTVCDNGRWTGTSFTCEETTTPNLTHDNSLNELCSPLTINNGQTFVKDASNGIYDVKCDKGYKLAFDKVYKCTDGKWIGKEPECRKVAAKCQFPPALRARSIFRRKGTREVIYTMFVDHWTQAVQTCKKKSRGETSRIVKCVNGRWRPSLMPCRQKHDRVAIIKDTTPRVAETTSATSTVKPNDRVAIIVAETTSATSTVKPSLVRTKIVKPPADQTVVRGSMAKFDCNVINDPNVRVTWSWRHSRLGSEISSDSRVRMNPDGTLVMYSIRPDDAGNYTCVVTSSTGNDTRTATLKVIELPQAPFITSIQINTEDKRAASVKWIPGFDGNTPVKKFTLQYKEVRAKSGLDGWVSFDSDIPPTARETTVTGLLPGKRYQFRVFASNEVGDGPPSSPRPIPAIQIPNENGQETVITDTKPKVAETTKTTSILKQNDQVMVTTDTIPKADETTTNSTTEPSTEYRVHVQVTQGAELPAYIVLDGNENRGVELALVSPENFGGLSVFTVKGINVGEIEKISTSSTNNTDVNFVSIHNPDVSGFYIQRFKNFDSGRLQEIMGKPCKRQYGENLNTLPLYCSGKGKDFSNVKDIIDCKLLCIEELDFTCKVAYYHKGHHTCYALEKYDTNCYINVSGRGKGAIFLFKRADTC